MFSLFKKKKNSKLMEKFYSQFLDLKKNEDVSRGFRCTIEEKYPCLYDATENTTFDTHYIYHVAWAIHAIMKTCPQKHVDIASSLHFSTALSALMPVDFYDFRPAKISLPNLRCFSADLMNLEFANESIESLSCMHTIEHVGLGRYGDTIDYNADIVAIDNLKRVLKPGGMLYFVVPITGDPRIEYNAHRVYTYGQVLSYFEDFALLEFSLVPDNAESYGLLVDASVEQANAQSYGCGCFHFRKVK